MNTENTPYQRQPVHNGGRYDRQPSGNVREEFTYRQPDPDILIDTVEMPIERKVFKMSLRENNKGQILRIIEEVGGRHSTIIVPASGLPEFMAGLAKMVKAAERAAPKKP